MTKLVMVLASGIIVLSGYIGIRNRSGSHPAFKQRLNAWRPEVPTGDLHGRADDSATTSFTEAALVSSLPSSREGLREKLSLWCQLEAALLNGDPELRARLVERFLLEPDQGYKGLLGIMLSADPGTRRRIFEELRLVPQDGWDLFRGLAIFAIVKDHLPGPDAALTEQNADQWRELFDFTYRAARNLWARSEYRRTGEYVKALSCSSLNVQLNAECELSWRAQAVEDGEVLAYLTDLATVDGDWHWIQWLSREAVGATAEKNPQVARSVAETFLSSGSRDRALHGFNMLGEARLPTDSFHYLEKWARGSLDDAEMFEKAVRLLVYQGSGESEQVLSGLYDLTHARDAQRSTMMEAMALSEGPSFKRFAELELQSGHHSRRVNSLRILLKKPTSEDLQLVARAVASDGHARVRYSALVLLQQRNVWTATEERILESARNDPDSRIRAYVAELASAPARLQVETDMWNSQWEWPDPGEEE